MILYKYVDFEGGCKILRNNSIGFRQPLHLNDPTEISAAYPKNDYFNERDFIEMSYRRQLKEYVWRTYYAILSLTRAPNTSLMWSHYAQNHGNYSALGESPGFKCVNIKALK
jgi:hypothetical protein